jgi:hypothetical protein
MATNDKAKTKESPSKDKITKAQEIFVNELIRGKSQRQAFLRAYPEKASWKWSSIDSAASTLLKKEKVAKRYDVLMNRIRAEELEKTKWTREQAIETLKGVIKRNVEEHEKIQAAIDSEIELLLKKIKKNPHKAEEYTKELLRKRKARIVSSTHNAGIISAVSELNKMQGFNEETINLNGSVVFSGEDQLED